MLANGQFRLLRILVLLLVLLAVAASNLLTRWRTTDWDRPLVVAIYPMNADGSAAVADYIAQLDIDAFSDIDRFFAQEADFYQLPLRQPFEVVLGPVLTEQPPLPAEERSVLGNVLWSLKMRYWAWRVARSVGPPADVQMFVRYHDPQSSARLQHSLGLQKGLLGMVNVYAGAREAGGSRFVIAHEILHTVGASDKYDRTTNLPLFPVGYAEPEREPLLPQEMAEIMAGRIPLAPGKAEQVRGLNRVLIGRQTAREIFWIE